MKLKVLITAVGLATLFAACQKDPFVSTPSVELDDELKNMLQIASGGNGTGHYLLPYSMELEKIPQDPNNPISQEKVNLGALLFHETGLALNPMHVGNEGTYSCASCHFASAGFQAGRHQGISDGGIGFGVNGEGREPNLDYDLTELDVQPIRSPSALNSAYQKVNLWNGQFGATGPNSGTEALWPAETPIEKNHLGFEGVETQAIAALDVHRLDLDETICRDLGYMALFDKAFPHVPEEDRYSKVQAGLAIAAYERTLLANQSPFQKWLRGTFSAMTDQEKEGAVLFFGKAGCVSCHDGPNLANMEFHAYGMKDLYETPEASFNAFKDSEANLGRYSFTKKRRTSTNSKYLNFTTWPILRFMGTAPVSAA